MRPALAKLLQSPGRRLREGGVLTLIFVGVLLSAVAGEAIGIHLIFGAFLFGAVSPRTEPRLHAVRDNRLERRSVAHRADPALAPVP